MTWKKLTRDLTADDVGKKVRLRNGDEDVITEVFIDEEYSIYTETFSHRPNGEYYQHSPHIHSLDIVEFYEEASEESDVTLKSPLDYYETYSPQTNLTVSIGDGTEVVKGRFKDSSGKEWYVTMERF
jgi:hypothetical protein